MGDLIGGGNIRPSTKIKEDIGSGKNSVMNKGNESKNSLIEKLIRSTIGGTGSS